MKCPGQDTKYWNADAIFDVQCPNCDKKVEFYKDDTSRKCHHCGHRFVNPKMDFGCATYCQFAEQCLGTLPDDFRTISTDNLLKDKIAVEVKRHYHTDFKKIRLVSTIAQQAETIGKDEEATLLPVILCAAYLHDLDLADAKEILAKAGAGEQLRQAIGTILEQLPVMANDSDLAAKIVHDARSLVLFREEMKQNGTAADLTPPVLFTDSAAALLETQSA